MSSSTLYLFGDQSAELTPSIQHLTRQSHQCEPLRHFLRAATDIVQETWTATPAHLRPQCRPFDSPLQLAEAIDPDQDCTAFLSALLSISQLGSFILHLVSTPRALEGSSNPAVFGVCTGSLSAAAVAASHNLTELIALAPLIVALAFRIGLEATKRSQLLEKTNRSWATVVNHISAEDARDAVKAFNDIYGNNHGQRVYISATVAGSVTVSGPPSVLDRFFETRTTFQDARRFDLPIKAAFHASHLPRISSQKLIDLFDPSSLDREMQHKLISPSSAQAYKSLNLGGVLEEIITEILQLPIDFDGSTDALSKALAQSVTVHTMGPVFATKAIEQALSSHDVHMPLPHFVTSSQKRREGTGAIAIVGMAVRLPGSETLEEFWRVLEEGQALQEKIRADRFDWRTHCDPTGKTKNTSLTQYGVFIDRPGYFDPKFFNLSPREALHTDPQQRLMLLTTYEALENAGYSPNRTPSTNVRRIASFLGQTSDDYREVNAGQEIDTYFTTGGIRAFGPGRVNYYFGWEGPSFSLDTACSSSAASIQLACSALLARECDTAVGGGANLLTASDQFAGLSKGGFLSKNEGCKTFDEEADGYVRADGCGVLVLKRLEDAVKDRDNILAVMRGAATNHSAEAVSITHPHNETQQRLFKSVLSDAGVLPHEIDYAELHGTGTQAGDTTETKSVTSVLCRDRSSSNPLYIGSVKPNVGHGEAASGVTSIIKAVLMLQKHIIPPHIGIKNRINQNLPPLQDLNTHIAFQKTAFQPRSNSDGKRRILVNNFDAAGGNTSLLLEDPPKLLVTGHDPRGYQVIVLSAKSTTALANNTQRLLQFLKTKSELRLEDIAYTTSARRIHHSIRKAYAVPTRESLISDLEKQVLSTQKTVRILAPPSVVFCFTGQGSQYVSMGSVLYKTLPNFRDSIDEYDTLCLGHGFGSFLPLVSGDPGALDSPVQVQLAIVAVELALALVWKSLGVLPKAVIGHSIGEYAALCCAGVLSASDCLYLVGHRASLMMSACTPGTHAMLAVQASSETLDGLLLDLRPSSCEVACFNAPGSLSLSGISNDINNVHEKLRSLNIKASRLEVPYAFHSSQIDTIVDKYARLAANVHFAKPEIPVASTLKGEIIVSDKVFDAKYLSKQARSPVQFEKALNSLKGLSFLNEKTVFVEIGPTPICLGMIKATLNTTNVLLPSLRRGENDWKTFNSSVAHAYDVGIDIDWSEYHRPFESNLRMIQLPNYCFDLKNYWIPYVGDWNLRKGQPQDGGSGPATTTNFQLPTFSTTSLHRIESEEIDEKRIAITFVSEASEPILNEVLRGHIVNGAGLCPSSVYADMALTAARYAHKLAGTSGHFALDVGDMDVHKPLIIKPGHTSQTIRTTALLDRASGEVQVRYSSHDNGISADHAHCLVRKGNGAEWQSSCNRHAYLIRSRMNQLVHDAQGGGVHKILRSMAYKLFASFVEYDEKYRGMEEVYLNSSQNEACARIKFRTNVGKFEYNPYWIDSVAHLSGFILNGSDTTPADSVFISHGWSSMKFLESLSIEKEYQSYMRMQPGSMKGIMSGDLYLFDQDRVVAVIENLRFQQIKRTILEHLLPNPLSITRAPAPPAAATPNAMGDVPTPRATQWPILTPAIPPKQSRHEFMDVLRNIAGEIGTEVTELDDDATFADLGVDSLLTIHVLSSLSQQLGDQLPPTLIIDNPSVRDLRAWYQTWINKKQSAKTTNSSYQHSSDADSMHGYDPFSGDDSPGTPMSDYGGIDSVPSQIDTAEMVKKIIAHEVGTLPQEIEPDTLLSELGIDSFLSLSILARIRDQMGITLSSTFLIDHPTFAEVRRALGNIH